MTDSSIGKDIKERRALAEGGAWRRRYEYDWDSGTAVAVKAEGDHIGALLQNIQVEQGEGNTLVAHIPSLAVGTALGAPQIGGVTTNEGDFAKWDAVVDNTDGKGDLRKAIKWWRKDPLVFRNTKVLTQLANCKFCVQTDNETVEELICNWVKLAMPHSFRQAWFTEYFRTGMVPIFKTLIPYIPRDYKDEKIPRPDESAEENIQLPLERQVATAALLERNRMIHAQLIETISVYENHVDLHAQGLCGDKRLEKYRQAAAAMQHVWEEGMIPGAYTILDPLSINIKGPEEMTWLREPFLKVSEGLKEAVKNPGPRTKEIVGRLPAQIIAQIRNNVEEIWLPPNVCTIFYGDKQPYEKYPTPIAVHCFDALDVKYSMIEMDRATAVGTKNRILKVTIGNDEYPEFDEDKLRSLALLFLSPTRNMNLFWNHTLQIEWIEPGNEVLLDSKKYDPWNDEIRSCYGVSRILTGTSDQAGAIGNSIMNFKGVQEEVSEAQALFLQFFDNECRLFRMALGLSADVRAAFENIDLEDVNKFRAVLNQYVQGGLLDEQTALETLGYHFPTIVKRMKSMKELRDQGLFESKNQFGGGFDGGGIQTGGKPADDPGADNNQNKKGQSQPKLVAAKVIPIDKAMSAIVVDVDDVDDEHRADIAHALQAPKEWVMTSSEYTKRFGHKPDMTAPWPILSEIEVAKCMKDVGSVHDEFQNLCEEEEARFREAAQNTEGAASKANRRGSYITAKRRSQIQERVLCRMLSSYRPESVDKDVWESRFWITRGQLQSGGSDDLTTAESDILATLMLSKRWAKGTKQSIPKEKIA